MSRRIIRLAIAALVLSAAGAAAYRFGPTKLLRFRQNHAAVVVAPPPAMTIELESRVSHPDLGPSPVISARITTTYLEDGATATYERSQKRNGEPGGATTNFEMPGGIKAHVNHYFKAFFAMKLGKGDQNRALMRFDPVSDCANRADGQETRQVTGEDKVFGIRVVKFESRGWTTWVAPSLGCVELHKLIVFKQGVAGEVSNANEVIATKITMQGAQDLFKIPKEYEFVSPYDLETKPYMLSGKPIPDSVKQHNKQLMELYAIYKFDPRTAK